MGVSEIAGHLSHWRDTHPATSTLSAVLVAAFAVESVVWWLFGYPAIDFWFSASASPSPGWLLAPLAHSSLAHLGGNLLFLLVYGSLAEADLSVPTWYWLFAVSALAGTAAQVWSYLLTGVEGGAVGASAGVVALVSFVGVRTALAGPDERSTAAYLLGVAGGVGMLALIANDFLLTSGSGSAEFAHLLGVAVGTLAGLSIRR
jgi:membrane associated rhomboid family serine protease